MDLQYPKRPYVIFVENKRFFLKWGIGTKEFFLIIIWLSKLILPILEPLIYMEKIWFRSLRIEI
jgi:hypothetical protein